MNPRLFVLAILFTVARSATDIEINLVAADGLSEPRRLGDAGLSASGWSSDGESVLAIDNRSMDEQSLVILDSETGKLLGELIRARRTPERADFTERLV